ncbi:6,7-dimethyl-8-ribityllumazine synthase [Corynebacterium humireducens NBRC 106098 = DSM 45392]|uniref:6,7-dimethyl-8-ribityllumazine synthase n=1 Tax=Corynebacterium humireducens NBRC 106098 = DSM 45392 TaxID=1223515 RepID=A0A0B5D841_9CORY|nr:6,7-dimethyl-8-ribityllumazine synthase [Corynebacterium humireducens]AJE33262.1 6,7-dimethyl-8-ribityllumazine synthase [Corynebacterium humireducens NBRC 106098 = DSM 45392]
MSKEGLPVLDGTLDAAGLSVAVVTARWNTEICEQMRRNAVAAAREAGVEKLSEAHVMGALELPVVVQEFARTHDAVVALGCVIRGGTPHFDYVCDSVTEGLTRIALDESTPIGNGVLTTNDEQQAIDRAGFADSVEDKGAEAMIAALDAALTLRRIRTQAGLPADQG